MQLAEIKGHRDLNRSLSLSLLQCAGGGEKSALRMRDTQYYYLRLQAGKRCCCTKGGYSSYRDTILRYARRARSVTQDFIHAYFIKNLRLFYMILFFFLNFFILLAYLNIINLGASLFARDDQDWEKTEARGGAKNAVLNHSPGFDRKSDLYVRLR